MKKFVSSSVMAAMLVATISSCLRRPIRVTPTASFELASPVAESPAAGICAEHEGSLVSVTIFPDIPNPRCSYVRPEQRLQVINMRGETIRVRLARLETQISPGEDHIFIEPFGALLMPGVHRFEVSPCCGAELILRPGP